jgi:hypothetical protein
MTDLAIITAILAHADSAETAAAPRGEDKEMRHG